MMTSDQHGFIVGKLQALRDLLTSVRCSVALFDVEAANELAKAVYLINRADNLLRERLEREQALRELTAHDQELGRYDEDHQNPLAK